MANKTPVVMLTPQVKLTWWQRFKYKRDWVHDGLMVGLFLSMLGYVVAKLIIFLLSGVDQ